MPHPTAVILVVGLNQSLIGDDCPRIRDFVKAGHLRRLKPVLPAVTCSVQSSMLTGLTPGLHPTSPPRGKPGAYGHGIVGNGWYNDELSEVHFWKQSNHLVAGEKVWDLAKRRDPKVTTLNMFWWFNMYSRADYSVTPRPIYKADGRKIPDCYSKPPELRDKLQAALGPFPLFHFWGPGSSIKSSQWIADATKLTFEATKPTLTLVYLPHLDYALQKFGPPVKEGGPPESIAALREIDAVVGDLIDFFQQRGVRPILVSEYGIEPVDGAIPINRWLRENTHLLAVREEQGLELLDPGASSMFAVADHQVAHVYMNETVDEPYRLLAEIPGVDQIFDKDVQYTHGIRHERSGTFVLTAKPGKWFSYDYWLDDAKAPDFARTVDIHRKPGYDPLELFIDPKIAMPKTKLALRLFQRKILKQRALLDVIPLDTKLVRGSHGRVDQAPAMQPVIVSQTALPESEELPCTAVRDLILKSLFDA